MIYNGYGFPVNAVQTLIMIYIIVDITNWKVNFKMV